MFFVLKKLFYLEEACEVMGNTFTKNLLKVCSIKSTTDTSLYHYVCIRASELDLIAPG